MRYYDQNNIVVRSSTKLDVDYLKDHLRESDRQEVWASHNFTPEEALTESMKSVFALTVQNGSPLAMFGINAESILGDRALIWFLASDKLDDIGIRFLKNSRYFVDIMLEFYPYLYNYTDARNTQAIKWLKFLGADMEEPKPYGIEGLDFIRFSFRRK